MTTTTRLLEAMSKNGISSQELINRVSTDERHFSRNSSSTLWPIFSQ